MATPVIPTFHVGIRNRISDPDNIVNYVLRHILMNPGSISSLHSKMEVSAKKMDAEYPSRGLALAQAFKEALQTVLDRYATDDNRYMVATDLVDNKDGVSQTIKLSIKATYNGKLISYDRDFLVNQTKDFRSMIMDANKLNTDDPRGMVTDGVYEGTLAPVDPPTK